MFLILINLINDDRSDVQFKESSHNTILELLHTFCVASVRVNVTDFKIAICEVITYLMSEIRIKGFNVIK